MGSALLEIATLLEPEVFEQREPGASLSYAYAAVALSGLSEFARNGIPREDWWRNSRFAAESIFPQERAQIELEIATALRAEGRVAEARSVLLAVLDDFHPATRPWALCLLADMDRARGDALEALQRLDQSEDALDLSNPFHRQVQAVIFGFRGLIDLELGINDQAAYWFEVERQTVSKLASRELELSVLIHSAAMLLATPRSDEAFDQLTNELEASRLQNDDPAVRASLLSMHARVAAYRALNEALDTSDAADELVQALADPALPSEEAIDARLFLVRLLIAQERLTEATRELNLIDDAIQAASQDLGTQGRARDRGLLAALRCELELARSKGPVPNDHLVALEDAFASMLLQWERTPLRSGGVGFLNSQERLTVLDVLIRSEIATWPGPSGRRKALESLVRAQARGTLARELEAPSCDLDRIRGELLPPDTGMLIYLPTPQRTHLFALDRQDLQHFELAGDYQFEDTRREFQWLLESPPSPDQAEQEQLQRWGLKLRDVLLPEDLRSRLTQWSQLTIVGIENLGHLPFEALPFDESLLGLEFPIGYLPSIPIGLILKDRAKQLPTSWDRDLLLVSAPITEARVQERWPNLGSIDFSPGEVKSLFGHFDPMRVLALHGPAATRTAFLKQLPTTTRMLHLFVHGVRDANRERSSGLALGGSDDDWGLLWPADIESHRVPPLVLLSACGAARGPVRLGDDGASHLGGAFLRAGAICVVLSRADLELRSAKTLALNFTNAVSLGATPAKALLFARRQVASEFGQAPFYFALTHAIGLAHLPLFDGNWTQPAATEPTPLANPLVDYFPYAAGLIMLAGLAIWLKIRRRNRPSGH